MATVTDVEVANQSFPNVRQDLNDILEALATNFSADAEPTTTYPNQFWYETDTNLLYIRNEANDAWVTLASINQSSGEWEPRTAVIQAIDSAGLAFKTDEGTTRLSIADDGSVAINGNSIVSTDTNGVIALNPNGTGNVRLSNLNYPASDGTDGQVLTTDGSGNIAFEDAAGGAVLQVQSFTRTSALNFTVPANAESGNIFDVNITPTSASSDVLVIANVQIMCETPAAYLILNRDGTDIAVGDAAGSRKQVTSFFYSDPERQDVGESVVLQFLDSPNTTSQVTYSVTARHGSSATQGFHLNANEDDSDDSKRGRFVSTITVMEIAG